MARRASLAGLWLAICALVAHAASVPPTKPASKPPGPDLEFLEYLGTLESDEENWTDIVAMKPKQTPAPKSSAPAADSKAKTLESSRQVESTGK